jgi:hypothetical protein
VRKTLAQLAEQVKKPSSPKEQMEAMNQILEALERVTTISGSVGPKGPPVSGYMNSTVQERLEAVHLPVGYAVIGRDRAVIQDPVMRAYKEKHPQATYVECVWSEDEQGNSILTVLGTYERRMTSAERWAQMAKGAVDSTVPIAFTKKETP